MSNPLQSNPPILWTPQLTSDSLKECSVKAYTAAGLTLFALGGTPENDYKDPSAAGWQNTVYVPTLAASQLPDIYGVLATDELFFLDFDAKRGQTQLSDLWAHLNLPRPVDTFIVQTGDQTVPGGCHLYFRKPADFPILNRHLDKEGFNAIEIKAKGRYVVAAGSLHYRTGNYYQPIRRSPSEIAYAPDALLEFIRKRERVLPASRDGNFDDSPGAQQSFIHYIMNAAPPAVEGQNGDSTTVSVALVGRDYGLTEDACLALMLEYYNPAKCRPEWSDEGMEAKVRSAYRSAKDTPGNANASNDFKDTSHPNMVKTIEHPTAAKWEHKAWDTDKTGKLAGTMQNVANMFMLPYNPTNPSVPNELYELIRHNSFADDVEFTRPAPWHVSKTDRWFADEDYDQLELFLSYCRHFNPYPGTIIRGVNAVARMYSYHPITTWLNSIVWDGVPRLDMLFPLYMNAEDTEYNREVGKNLIIAACARVRGPGSKHDSMPVLESSQGWGKTEFVKILGGDHLPHQKWFADIPLDPKERDTTDKMLGAWFLEASEMEFMSKVDVAAFKRWMTLTADKERLAYKRKSRNYLRQSVLIGSINPEKDQGYLTDETGNRRFWPVTVGRLEKNLLIQDREQIFAEADYRYRQGEPWHIVREDLIAVAKQEQAKRLHPDHWQEIIESWLSGFDGSVPLTSQLVVRYGLELEHSKMNRNDSLRLGRVMRKLGYLHSTSIWRPELKATSRVWVKDPFA